MFKSLTRLPAYVVCILLPVTAAAQSSEQPVFDSFSYTSDPLFTPLLVRSRIVVPPKTANKQVAAAPKMSARAEKDMRLAIDKAAAEILKLTVDYTELLKIIDTLRAEIEAGKSGWSVFSNDDKGNSNTSSAIQDQKVNQLELALDRSRKQVAGLEKQLATIQARLNAAQANFEGENAARLLAEQRVEELRQRAAGPDGSVLQQQLQQKDARIAQLESDLAASRAKLDTTAAPPAVASMDSGTGPITDLALAAPVREWIIAGLEFELGSADIRKGTEANLQALLVYLQQKPKIQIQVDGYTDSIGTVADNLKLSQDRAQAVADYLIKGGIDAQRIRVVGYGEGRPIATNMYKAGRAKNRRVAIIFFDE